MNSSLAVFALIAGSCVFAFLCNVYGVKKAIAIVAALAFAVACMPIW